MKKILLPLFALSFTFTSIALAAKVSAVDSHSCKTMRGTTSQFILVLKKDEDVAAAITQCVKDANLKAASLTGLGALKNPTLDFYNTAKKQYEGKTFYGIYELISMNGNITRLDNNLTLHMHAALGDDNFHVMGGHLRNAVIGVTGEITITPMSYTVIKKFDAHQGLNLIYTG